MLDKLIRAGRTPDWISPLVCFILDFKRRPSVGYTIPVHAGWSAYALRNLLTQGGIQLWGLTIYDNLILFRTRKAQALYAQYLMERAGIPYAGGIATDQRPGPQYREQAQHRRPAPPQSLNRYLDQGLAKLDRLF